jgi:hypothetical protein
MVDLDISETMFENTRIDFVPCYILLFYLIVSKKNLWGCEVWRQIDVENKTTMYFHWQVDLCAVIYGDCIDSSQQEKRKRLKKRE